MSVCICTCVLTTQSLSHACTHTERVLSPSLLLRLLILQFRIPTTSLSHLRQRKLVPGALCQLSIFFFLPSLPDVHDFTCMPSSDKQDCCAGFGLRGLGRLMGLCVKFIWGLASMSSQHRGFVRVSEGDTHGCDPWFRGEGEGAKVHVLSLRYT